MTEPINAIELLNKAYKSKFEEIIKKRYSGLIMKCSNLKYQIYESYGNSNYEWELQFEKSIDFGNGNNYRKFIFNSDLELGKFIFECELNNGFPKGSKGVFNFRNK